MLLLNRMESHIEGLLEHTTSSKKENVWNTVAGEGMRDVIEMV